MSVKKLTILENAVLNVKIGSMCLPTAPEMANNWLSLNQKIYMSFER